MTLEKVMTMVWSVMRKVLVAIVAIILLLVAIGVGYVLWNQGPATPAGAAPTVTFTSPVNGASGTATNAKILATFSETMKSSTITTSTFTMKHGTTATSGAVTYTGLTATFAPASNLAASTTYTATITTGAKDLAGQALVSNYVWNFTTGATTDTTAPTVTSTTPASSATGAPINGKLTAVFGEPMDPSTITKTTFTLKQGTTSVSGTVTYAGLTATLSPEKKLSASTTYTATITTGAKDLAGNALASNYVWNFTTGTTEDTTAPHVISTSPLVAVPVNSNISATFSEAMDPSTITTTTFSLKQGTTSVSGTVTYAGHAATFNPTNNLVASSTYTATITTGSKDLAGNALESNYVWSFTTGLLADTTPPTVVSTSPIAAVAVNSNILATFSEPMDPSTISGATFTIKQGTTTVTGTVTFAGLTATFNPTGNLAANTAYTATITTGAKDLAGNPLAGNYVWAFTTAATSDATAPTVTSKTPANSATDVPVDSKVTAVFSEAMVPSTITATTFMVTGPGTTPVAGTVTYSAVGTTATFTPTSNLAGNTIFTATITTGVTDLAGNELASAVVWTFTTGAAPSHGPAPVELGTAGNFVILAKTGISTTGTTAIVGNIGVSPAAQTYITGFSETLDSTNVFATSILVTGKIFAADMAVPTPSDLTTAVSDMETAFTDAAGRTHPDETNLGGGNIDGMTLAPGLYKWGTGVDIPTGVTLAGGANDVWIFQIAQDLTVGNGAIVALSGGAQAKNIFWQVSGQVTLGTTSDFKGIILCQTAIVMETGAVLNGVALAQTAVTLDANAVTKPA